MTSKEEFIKEGFNVIANGDPTIQNRENPLAQFLKANYPSVIKDGEIKLDQLKTAIGIPIDDKVNGYGLNFIGRNVAKAKYEKETDKALKINTELSKDFENTQNMVIKGDNLDALKLLRSYYSGKIKMIYIDPPYNTNSENFIYPDKFDRQEQEVLGLMGISQTDFERLEFSFKNPKSHNGWLTFMYPRLKLARDLLTDDGVIFISIDDNEQANLKLLCDEIFGEENFVASFIVVRSEGGGLAKQAVIGHDYLLVYAKQINNFMPLGRPKNIRGKIVERNGQQFWIETDWLRKEFGKYGTCRYEEIEKYKGNNKKIEIDEGLKNGIYVLVEEKNGQHIVGRYRKIDEDTSKFYTILKHLSKNGIANLEKLGLKQYFDFPKPVSLLKEIILGVSIHDKEAIILDFFAGSGTTAHAVMELNKEDGGNRKFILCQIDEPIKEDNPAYKFCKDNHLPCVISSITIERLNRAGKKLKSQETESDKATQNLPLCLCEQGQSLDKASQNLDIGYKVFDLVDAPSLTLESAQMEIAIESNNTLTPLDRIYNMIFKVGVDNPTVAPKEILKNCIYLHEEGNSKSYYVTNSQELGNKENKKLLKKALREGVVYIDGWTASINTSLQEYKKDNVKIIF
jgi:adenine-specific DNA-methyltransferase